MSSQLPYSFDHVLMFHVNTLLPSGQETSDPGVYETEIHITTESVYVHMCLFVKLISEKVSMATFH